MSESTLSEIIKEEVRRSLYEAPEINDDRIDLVHILATVRELVQKPPKASSLEAENAKLWREISRLNLLINSPQTADFMEAVRVEAPHQVRYWNFCDER